MIWHCICQLQMRFQDRFNRWPLRLLQICDRRHTLQQRTAVACEFSRCRECCLPLGAGLAIKRLLQSMCTTAAAATQLLMTERWHLICALSSVSLDCSMADVEDRHAHCKASASGGGSGSSADLVFARHVLRESRHAHRSHQPPENAAGQDAPEHLNAVSLNRPSGILLFHQSRV